MSSRERQKQSTSHSTAQYPCRAIPFERGQVLRENMNQLLIYWELTSLSSRSIPGLVHSLPSLGCQRRKLIFSCRTFWQEASLNGASFGLAFFYLLWDEQPANSAVWSCFLSLTLFSFCSTEQPLILCFYQSVLPSQVQLLCSVSCFCSLTTVRQFPNHTCS